MAKQNIFAGDIYANKDGDIYTVVDYTNATSIVIKFLETNYETIVAASSIRNKTIKDKYKPTIYGVGYLGKGNYLSKENNKATKAYDAWKDMLRRCYNLQSLQSRPTYKDCSVDSQWHNFQNFAEFYYNDPWRQEGWQLDKDISCKGNRAYGPETCCFVPPEINSLLNSVKKVRGMWPLGVSKVNNRFHAQITRGTVTEHLAYCSSPQEAFSIYKKAKELYIKKVANKWRDRMDDRVYKALIGWEILIED